MMKKIILIICLIFGFSQMSNAQVDFGIKGGVNYNSNSIKETGQDVFDGAKRKRVITLVFGYVLRFQ